MNDSIGNSSHKPYKLNEPVGILRINSAPFRKPDGFIYYRCVCACDTILEVRSRKLKSGKFGSCGCLMIKNRETVAKQNAINQRKKYGCRKCKTTDPKKFAGAQKSLCRKCSAAIVMEKRRSDPVFRAVFNERCRKAREKTPKSFLAGVLNRLRKDAKKKPDIVKSQCDLDIEYLMGLWDKQNGKCALSKAPMGHRHSSLFSISIDRLDNKEGHTKGNVHLVCKGMNIMRNSHSLDEVLVFLEAIYQGARI